MFVSAFTSPGGRNLLIYKDLKSTLPHTLAEQCNFPVSGEEKKQSSLFKAAKVRKIEANAINGVHG
jgi:hypothetical protein